MHREIEQNNELLSDGMLNAINRIVYGMEEIKGSLLPQTVDEFNLFKGEDTQSMTRRLAENTIQKRSVEWIKENGICLDAIRPGKSNIPGAGWGAFAQGFIRKGDIVSPAPLLNVANRETFNIYEDEVDEETGEVVDSTVIGQQLLLNYCFGHTASQLLLCPQTNSILLNHCSKRTPELGQCGKDGPNAKAQWAQNWDVDTAEWLQMSLDEVIQKTSTKSRGLSIEIIATRDISPGEEVTIDYGENWERDWVRHVKTWKAPIDDGTYIPVRTMIENNDLRTVDELKSNPYPENVQLVCFFWEPDIEEGEEISFSATDLPVDGIEASTYLEPCEIVERSSEGGFYTVRIFSKNDTVSFEEYPEESISFRMKKYTSDMHLPGVFRHFIEIDDSIFPDGWKNLST